MDDYCIEVSLRASISDPVGATVAARLDRFGLSGFSVSASRLYLIQISGDSAAARRIAAELLADPIIERFDISAAGENIASPDRGTAFEVHFLPGVMDPVAASTAAAIRDLGYELASVRTVHRFVLTPSPSDEQARRIRSLLGNACIQEVVVGTRPLGPPPRPTAEATGVRTVALGSLDLDGLTGLSRRGHLFLSPAEMRAIQAEFTRLGRDPTDLELETLAQTWSEHCVHKTLRSEIVYRGRAMPAAKTPQANDDGREVEIRYANLLADTIARATRELIAEDRGLPCLSVFEDNAGVIGFDERYGVAFKVETHNHPSAIEPYGGAATGLGGCIRDVLGCGLGARPIACTDVFCVAPPDWSLDALPRGALHPRLVLPGVVAGVRDYGNRMGIPTLNGAIHFDPRYLGNPLVFCGCVGLIPRDRVAKAARPGDAIVLVGGRTGRDGIHGATFSSAELTDTHADEFSHAVQIGNAIEEKKMQDVLLQARDFCNGGPPRCLYSAVTDCGAGGLSSAIGEMAAQTGAEVDLERVPLKYAGLRYDEIWISESQERMVLAAPPENLPALLALARAEDVEATVIGHFTDTGRLVVRHRGEGVGDLPTTFLHEGRPREIRRAEWNPEPVPAIAASRARRDDLAAELRSRLRDPTVASKEWVIRQYDHEVQGRSAIKPLVGPAQDGPSDAAVIRPRLDSDRGIAIGCGLCPQLSDHDPYWMAWAAIDEAIRNVVCVGADPGQIAILDNFCWGRPDDPRQLGALVRACQGCYDAAKAYGTPFISGKDSLNNEFALQSADAPRVEAELRRFGLTLGSETPPRLRIPGTLLISAVAIVADVRHCVTMDPKQPGAELWLVGSPTSFAGCGSAGGPRFDPALAARTHAVVAELICEGLVVAAHDASDGGVLVAVAEMMLAGRLGGRVLADAGDPFDSYFGFSPALYVVEPRAGCEEEFTRRIAAVPARRLARLDLEPRGSAAVMEIERRPGDDAPARIALAELRKAWVSPGM